MERKYLSSLIECIGETEMQPNSLLERMKMDRKLLEDIFLEYLQDESVYEMVVIAVDKSKDTDFVIGFILGQDIVEAIEETNETQEDFSVEQFCKIERSCLKLIPKDNLTEGQILIVDSYGVRKEYQGLKIGWQLIVEYLKSSYKLGYKIMTGICYSQISVHIASKLGSTTSYFLNQNEMKEIVPDLAERFNEGIVVPIISFEIAMSIIEGK